MTEILSLPLSSLSLLRVHGPDADQFLQGQLSNDLRLLSPDRGLLASYNSAKGRMLAMVQLLRHEQNILLEVHQSVAESTLKRLRMFVLRAKVIVEDATAECGIWGLIGPHALEVLEAKGLPVPAAAQDCATAEGLLILRRHGNIPRYAIYGPSERLESLFSDLPRGTFDDWKREDLRAGLATVYPETRELFVPQMANLDLLGGISFTKGCYTGQEIVARLHYLGQLKRRMFLMRAPRAAPPGEAVYDRGAGSQAVGEVVDCVAEEDHFLLTIVLQLSHAQSAHLRLGSGDGAELILLKAFAG